jgi:polar amino acid transport system substrate-binding protein
MRPYLAMLAAIVALARCGAGMAAEIVVGVEDGNYLPHYGVVGERYVGFGRDLLDAFAAEKGHTITYKAYPVARLWREFMAGRLDLKYPDDPVWAPDIKGAAAIAYSRPVIAYVDGVFVPVAAGKRSVADIRVLGTVRGFTPVGWLDRIKSGQTALVENTNVESLINQALQGRIDGFYANVASVVYQMEQGGRGQGALVYDPALPQLRGWYRVSSLRHPDLVAEFDHWLDARSALVSRLKQKNRIFEPPAR